MTAEAGASRVVETHVSWVVFLDRRVYKVKKPLRLPFLDWSSADARRAACQAEVELNRRLAPEVYLGVLDVVDEEGCRRDSMVEMRRLPAERSLAALVSAGRPVGEVLDTLAATLADFHRRCPPVEAASGLGTPPEISRRWEANFEEMAEQADQGLFDAASLERCRRLAEDYVGGRSSLFAERLAAERVRDGHGDLLADDIFVLANGPAVLDCLDFDARLRQGDVLADVAFLAMDLERLGAAADGARFLAAYRERAGDRWPASLAHHWVAQRAQIRAKVTAVRALQEGWPSAVEATAAGEEAVALLEVCARHLRLAQPRLILVGGAPGTGKTTVAGRLAELLGAAVVSSDEIRHRLPGPFPDGLYSGEASDATYRTLLDDARRRLEGGESVVADATWGDRTRRSAAAAVADVTRSALVEFRCDAPEGVAASRIARRRQAGGGGSDATAEIAGRLRRDADPWPSAVTLSTTGSPGAVATSAADLAVPEWRLDLFR